MPATPVDVSFRLARPEDQGLIAEFQLAMAWETERLKLDEPTVRRGVAAVFEDPSRGRYFVAEREGRVVGALLNTYEWSDWRNAVMWWIHSLYVVPELRGRGVYGAFYRHLQALAGREGARGIRLYVDRTNGRAKAVYARLGMSAEHYELYEWMR